jgi:hypothetical protein
MAVSPVHEPSMLKKCYRLVRNMLPDEIAIRLTYLLKTKQMLNLKNPKTFNEKMQWLKLYYHNPLLTQLADKYAVREYVKAKIGEQYLTKLYGVWHSSNDIVFSELPNEFVLKATHASGTNILCRDKSKLDWSDCCEEMTKWMYFNFYITGREWCYKNIRPRIICEEYLKDKYYIVPPDYKIHCFNGNPVFIQLISGRYQVTVEAFYSIDWNMMPFTLTYPVDKEVKQKPKVLDQMVSVAKQLSQGLPYVRVDLYLIDDVRIVFGETTIYPASGYDQFSPSEWKDKLGDLLSLPQKWL